MIISNVTLTDACLILVKYRSSRVKFFTRWTISDIFCHFQSMLLLEICKVWNVSSTQFYKLIRAHLLRTKIKPTTTEQEEQMFFFSYQNWCLPWNSRGLLLNWCGGRSFCRGAAPASCHTDLSATSDICLLDLRFELSAGETPGLCKSQQCWKSVRKAL
jgi:hypothetical protein